MAEEAQVALLLCDKHESEEMDVYCITCKRPTCIKCLPTDHHEHDVDTIPKLYRKIKNGRPDRIRELNEKIKPKLATNARHIQHVKCGNDTLLNENLERAETKRAELHKIVDELIDSHVDCMRAHNAKLDEEINKEMEQFEKDETALVNMLQTFKNTTMVGLDLIEYYERLKTKADSLKTIDLSQYYSRQIYQEGKVDCASLQEMIGKVEEIKSSTNTVEMISSFVHTDTAISTICPISSTEAWLTYKNTKELRLLNQNGQHIKSVKKDRSGLIFISKDNFFLSCNPKKKNILKIGTSGESSIWKDTSPLRAEFIGHALHGNVLITLVDEMLGTQTEGCQRRAQMVSTKGDELHQYEYGEDGITPVLTRPLYLTQNYNSDVCVVNKYEIAKDKYRGNVCVFYEDGGLKFVYRGHDGEFNPMGICVDSMCNILCINGQDGTINVVSSDGSFLKYLFTRDTCIPNSQSIALHKGVLWVGSLSGEVRVYRYSH